jgi:hypothetical protein
MPVTPDRRRRGAEQTGDADNGGVKLRQRDGRSPSGCRYARLVTHALERALQREPRSISGYYLTADAGFVDKPATSS